jgi:hypothetical protein
MHSFTSPHLSDIIPLMTPDPNIEVVFLEIFQHKTIVLAALLNHSTQTVIRTWIEEESIEEMSNRKISKEELYLRLLP